MRALYHLQPRKNWMNDPNGPVFIGDTLHMFYQHNPFGSAWGNMTWGHAVSGDLVRWKHLPHALAPTPGGPDKDGVFSGCCVMHEGRPHILYTGVSPEVLCLAVGDAKGEAFEKWEGNPILTVDNAAFKGWRDPFVWSENGVYRMVIGSGTEEGGTAFLYHSGDLRTWEADGELCRDASGTSGTMWECPNFLLFGKQALLIVSALPQGEVLCMQGEYADGKMKPGRPWKYDLGDCFYAPNTVQDATGRYVQFGWMRECGDAKAREEQGWQGMLTLPREVRVAKGGVSVRPAREVSQLRKEKLFEKRNFSVRSGDNPLKGIAGQQLEIDIVFEATPNTLVLETLRGGQDACARIEYDGAADVLTADMTTLSGGERRTMGGSVVGESRIRLHVFVDTSALEVYCNDRETLTTRAYPGDGCDGLRLYAEGGVRVHSLNVWSLGSAYEDNNLPEEG